MRSQKRIWTGLFGAAGLMVLILDAKASLTGALDGISLCMNTVIPSLFPFFLFSILLNSTLSGTQLTFLRPLEKLLGTPAGAESYLLLGFLSGYPVGAQCISESYKNRCIDWQDAHRLLGFCSNAGPAFIFGIGSCLFAKTSTLWLLWAIHIVSALLVGLILPNKSSRICKTVQGINMTIPQALYKAVQSIASVCGWVIIFRVLIAFLEKWCLWILPSNEQTFLTGLLELSNGCYRLIDIPSQGIRFVMFAAFLGFGGLSVAMQTASVTDRLGLGLYFPGKVIQGSISILLSGLLQNILFNPSERWSSWWPYGVAAIFLCGLTLILVCKKKRVEILC